MRMDHHDLFVIFIFTFLILDGISGLAFTSLPTEETKTIVWR